MLCRFIPMIQVPVRHLAPEMKLLVLELGISADPQLV